MDTRMIPRLGPSSGLSGALGLVVQAGEHAFAFNCLEGVISVLAHAGQRSKELLFAGTSLPNHSGLSSLTQLLLDREQEISFAAPSPFDGWFNALLLENDYSSEQLKEIDCRSYTAGANDIVASGSGINIAECNETDSACEYVYRITCKESAMKLYYAELGSLEKSLPESIRGADILILNTSRFPMLKNKRISEEELILELKYILKEWSVRSVFIGTSEGMELVLPTKAPVQSKIIAETMHCFEFANVRATVVHDRGFGDFVKKSLPMVLEADDTDESILLGLDPGITLHKRVSGYQYIDAATVIINENSYLKVFSVVDMAVQCRNRAFHIICGETLAVAISYLLDFVAEHVLFRPFDNVTISIFDDNYATVQPLLSSFELIAHRYAHKQDSYFSVISDTTTGQTTLFTENIDNLSAIKTFCDGLFSLVCCVGTLPAESLTRQLEQLKELQIDKRIGKLIVLYSGGTVISDLNF